MRFTYDVVCPFAYLASTRVDALAAEAGVTLEWNPVLLGGLLRAHGVPDMPMATMPPSKARLILSDIHRQAERMGVPLQVPSAHPRRSVNAMRLLVAVDPNRRPQLSADLYRAYWVEGRDIADLDVLTALAAPYGLDPRSVAADPVVRQALFDATDSAARRGVFGVPTFEVAGALHWGADRLTFVREALGLPPEPEIDVGRGGHLVAFHDVSSPFSYLAWTQIGRLRARTGCTMEVVPFLLGGLFRAIGTANVPLHGYSRARQRWQRDDMERHARRYGVPFRFPTVFPLRTVTAMRVACIAPTATDALYRAAWVDDRDVGDPGVLVSVLDDAGFDGQALVEQAGAPEVKARLHRNTERAAAAGVFGAPSFVVGGHVFWGQDRLEMVAAAVGGWRPARG